MTGATATARRGREAARSARGGRARAEAARRLELGADEAVLRSIVEAAVSLFEAEAASIALYRRGRERLVFRVAAGEQGQGVVGLAIPPDQGLVGYVFSTGQALAISDVDARPALRAELRRADAATCRARSSRCPLVDEHGTIGVLEVLDKRSEATFSLRDVELAAVFARQATVAIRASRVERDVGGPARRRARGARLARRRRPSGVDELVAAAVAELGGDERAALGRSSSRSPACAGPSPSSSSSWPTLLAVLAATAERGDRSGPGGRAPAARAAAPRLRAMTDEPACPAWSEPFVGDRPDGLAPRAAVRAR